MRPGMRARLARLRGVMPTRRNHWIMPVVALVLLLGVVVGAIIISSITRQHVQLDNGTVWITSLKNQKAARFNVRLQEADAAVSSSAQRFDVSQSGDNTVLNEGGRALGIKASTVGVNGQTDLKGETTSAIGGDSIAFLNTKSGDVWVGEADSVDGVSPTTAKPVMSLGQGGKVAVDKDGVVYGYRPSDAMVLTLDNPQGSNPREYGSLNGGKELVADDFTVVGGRPVVVSGGTLTFNGGSIRLPATGRVTLQQPPVDGRQDASWVAASTTAGLVVADLDHPNAKPVTLTSGGNGEAAQPVSSSGCVYAAWSQRANNFIKACGAPKDGRLADEPQFRTLKDVSETSQLTFRTNHRLVVLNDVTNGNVWNPDDSTDVIKLQWNQIQTEKTTTTQESQDTANNHQNFAEKCSATSGTIKAVDDTFGVRAGSEEILDVLRNDEQTDCSVLHIEKVESPGDDATVASVYDGRYLQLDATNAHAGTVKFSYSISDGREQTSSATVTLNVTDGDDDKAPRQTDTPPEYQVEQGASYTANALASFTDGDGDPMTLVSATPTNSDQVMVSTRADGQLVFNTGSQASGRVGVQVLVSDGEKTGKGMVYFSVRPANTLTAVIDPIVRQAQPGKSITVALRQYVHGTSVQPAQLSAVTQPANASTAANNEDMSFTFKAANPGTYYVPYTITQGTQPTTGLARIEVKNVDGKAAKPVAANDVALLGADNTAIVEPLANDVDPLGGVLAISSVSVPGESGIKTGIVGHKRVYLTARQVPTKPVAVSYTVANAQGQSQGRIVLQPPALSTQNNAPKAGNINVQVRAGGIVTIPVLDHVTYADGTTVKLKTALQYDKKTFKGLAFVSEDNVRYQAADAQGVYPVTYTVQDNLGNTASGTITITVHKKDAASKPAPTPADVEAQVAAGQKVKIPITLTGIDVDGDGDTLNGLGNTVPKLGRITETGADYLVYEAYADSSGTDTFSYAVEDWTGQRAQAQIRVGVFKSSSDSGVYARDDTLSIRPNTKVDVPVLINDISGDSETLTLDRKLDMQGVRDAKVRNNMIELTSPSNAGTAYVMYTVRTKAGLTDTGTLTVNVSDKAPISPPTAYDYKVPAAATIDKKTVDVDVKDWIANPSGTADELKVDVHPSARDHAHRKGGENSTVIAVDLTGEARAVPYTVTNTKYNITSTAFIQVPAYGVFPPTLRPKAPKLQVHARETIEINIADYVRVGAGKTASVESKESVSATKSDGGDLYVSDTKLKFTAAKDYAGPASITFTAVDGKKGKDKNAIINSAVLTLPITVIGRQVPPPTFSAPTIDVVPGDAKKTISLRELTHAPDGAYEDEKAYTYSTGGSASPIEATLSSDGNLTVSAPKDARPGTSVTLPIAIKYANGTVNAGVTLRVTQTNQPLARVAGQTIRAKAGTPEHLNILTGAYNPFPDTPLTVVGATTDDASRISVSYTAGGDLTITPASNIGASTNKVVVTVQDGTKDASRNVTAIVTVSIVDRPNPPLLSPVAGTPADGSVNLAWTPGASNGAPITEYEVDYNDRKVSCGANTTCQITGLTNGQEYAFTVRAMNEVGWSSPSNTVKGMPDKVPDAPAEIGVLGGYKSVKVGWTPPEYVGSAPDKYTVTITGAGGSQTQTVTGRTATFTVDNSAGGKAFTARVRAHNRAGDGIEGTSINNDAPWGDIDAPTVSIRQTDSTTVAGTVTLGDLHGAGCSGITLSTGGSVPCSSDGTFSVTIGQSDYFKPMSVTATVEPEKPGGGPAKATSNEIRPSYEIRKPDLTVSGSDGVCTARWSGNDKYDDIIVTFGGERVTGGSATKRIGEWQRCPSATAYQTLNGANGPSVTAQDRNYVYKVPPRIGDSFSLSWNAKDRNTIDVNRASDIQRWGQNATYVLTVNDHVVNGWTPDMRSIRASDVGLESTSGSGGDTGDTSEGSSSGGAETTPDVSWSLEVTLNNDSTYRDEAHGTLSGSGRALPTKTKSMQSAYMERNQSSPAVIMQAGWRRLY
ncbi:Ig-like domain-containing protein [Bifidobacterium pluvialisilvae]|uniref:Ig-like domain-containing protein n=1 Tax=Bifidobacterium pluvialisilvae TaxID=2834436 RepID=UPI001F419861